MKIRDEIESIGRKIADGINSKNAASISKFYTEDASLFPPGAARQNGRDAVQAYWQSAIDAGLSDVVLATVEIEEFGNVATEVGTVTGTLPSDGSGAASLTGKYVVIWKKSGDGRWRLHRDIWNFDS